MYTFFGLAIAPVIINLVAAIIKLTMDARWARKLESDFLATGKLSLESRAGDSVAIQMSIEPLRDNASTPLNSPRRPSLTADVSNGRFVSVNSGPQLGQMGASPSSQSFFHERVGRSREILHGLPGGKPSRVFLFVPCYQEPLANLLGAINGIAAQDYPRLQVFIGFDNEDVEPVMFTLCRLMSGVRLEGDLYDDDEAEADQDSTAAPSTPRKVIRKSRSRGDLKYNGLVQLKENPIVPSSPAGSRPGSTFNSPMFTGSTASLGGLTPTGSPRFHPRSATAMSRSNTPHADLADMPLPEPMMGPGGSMDSSRHDSSFDNPPLSPMFSSDACPKEYTVVYRGVEFTLFRFPHGGKLATQRKMYEKLNERLDAERRELEMMGADQEEIDEHCKPAVLPNTVTQLVGELLRYPESKAVTGFCVSRNEGSGSLWRVMQDAEYIESMIYRNAEALLGNVTCLPGVLTLFRWDVLADVSPDYFYQAPITHTFDFARRYLGEDRYMTHLLMERYGKRALGFSPAAVCKTEAPDSFYNLLRQRRRWFMGQLSNEVIMMCTPSLWAKFPLLLLTKVLMMLKVGGALAYLMVVDEFQWGMLAWLSLIIVPNWLFISIWCIKEGRLKPLYYWFNPAFMQFLLPPSTTHLGWAARRCRGDDAPDDDEEGDAVAQGDDEVVIGSGQSTHQQQRPRP
ncbi:glycosyl transferase family group 2-domain-containing protein [Catenaria anguillulae PL171]|uniref:chitin synthase n=1 Tax=Catenaria anguillulae PL171 TaxID=765915 RepID=A0A1Y2HVY9_9FUNG|nr:glycosyl transferase family group 2-domain-containing protein [Catenaria anguillulae PL171]